jgi:hypothetical protein
VKIFVMSLISIMVTSAVFASPLDKHLELCESSEAQALKGSKGSCMVVTVPRKTISLEGNCKGSFIGLNCQIAFKSHADEGIDFISMKCGKDLKKPSMDRIFEAISSSYNVAAVITTSNGKKALVNDPVNYHSLISRLIEVNIRETNEKSVPEVMIRMNTGMWPVQDLTCF